MTRMILKGKSKTSDAMKLAISQSFVNAKARILDDETMTSLISAYYIYMRNKTESGATEEEIKVMDNELSVLHDALDICHKLRDWINS